MNSTPKKKMKQQLLPATLTALKILQILEEFSDQDHPVAQTAIAEELDIDRKTVARCLEVMEGHMDYDIVHQRKGVYLVPDEDSFELSEIRLLIDSVLSSKGISADQTDVIVKKLSKLLNKHDRTHIRHIHSYKDWSKIDNQNVFWSIEVLDDAINKNVKVSFDYSTIGIDKKLHVIAKYTVSPVQLVFSNGQYFLLAFVDEEEEMRSFRIDRITNAKALGLVAKNKKKDVDWRDIASTYVEGHPYMSFGETERIKLLISEEEIGRVFDVFGTHVHISVCKAEDDKFAGMVEVTFRANTEDVYRFVVQNADVAEIIEPHSVRARILKFGTEMHTRYLSKQEDIDQFNYERAISDGFGQSNWLPDASNKALREKIVKNKSADKVWGINVDSFDEETVNDISEYSNLRILKVAQSSRKNPLSEVIDLSLVTPYPLLQKLIVEQRYRSSATVKIKNLKALQNCKLLNQITFFNVEFLDEIAFRGFEKLRLLSLRQCRLPNLDFVKEIPTLMRLEVSGDLVDDITGLYGHKKLRVLTVDNAFMKKFDIDALRKKNPMLRIEVHSQCISTQEDRSINLKLSQA